MCGMKLTGSHGCMCCQDIMLPLLNGPLNQPPKPSIETIRLSSVSTKKIDRETGEFVPTTVDVELIIAKDNLTEDEEKRHFVKNRYSIFY